MVDGSVITPGIDAAAVAPEIDEVGIESVPGSETGTEVQGTIAAGTAWGAGGAVITAPGAETLGLGAPGCDTGIVVPGTIAVGWLPAQAVRSSPLRVLKHWAWASTHLDARLVPLSQAPSPRELLLGLAVT